MLNKFIVAAFVLLPSFSFASGFKEFQHGMTKKSFIEQTTGDCKTVSKWCWIIKPKVDMILFGFPVTSMSASFDGQDLDSKLTEISVSVEKSQREFNTVAEKALGKPIVFKTTSILGNNLTVYMWKMKDGSFIDTTWVDDDIDGGTDNSTKLHNKYCNDKCTAAAFDDDVADVIGAAPAGGRSTQVNLRNQAAAAAAAAAS